MLNKTKKITISGLIIGIYIVFMYLTQSIAFGQCQVRFATGLYSFAYAFPFLRVPLGIANMLSNILLGGDSVNGILGFIAGFLTTSTICLLKKVTTKKVIIVLPIAIIPSVIIPIWLSYTLQIPYCLLVLSLLVGQTISAYTAGMTMMYISERLVKILNYTE